MADGNAGTAMRAKRGANRGANKGADLVSPYEKMMLDKGKTPDAVGKPPGSAQDDVAFSFKDRDRNLAVLAKRRALSLIIDAHRGELRDAFEEEYRCLAARQGYEDVPVRRVAVEKAVERRPFNG